MPTSFPSRCATLDGLLLDIFRGVCSRWPYLSGSYEGTGQFVATETCRYLACSSEAGGWMVTHHVDPGLITREACKGRQARQACMHACMQVAPGN